MDDNKTVPFPVKGAKVPTLAVEGTVTVTYNLQTQALNVKVVGLPNEVAVFALESAKHVLLHSLKMVPGEQPAPVEGKKE